MWEQYESPEEKRDQAAEFAPAASPIRAGGTRSGAGLVIGLVGFMVVVGTAIGVARSSDDAAKFDDSQFERSCEVDGEQVDPSQCDELLDDLDLGDH